MTTAIEPNIDQELIPVLNEVPDPEMSRTYGFGYGSNPGSRVGWRSGAHQIDTNLFGLSGNGCDCR